MNEIKSNQMPKTNKQTNVILTILTSVDQPTINKFTKLF